jgi:ribose 5-phosphate isomerase B
MKIALGTDHAGFPAKERVKAWLKEHGHDVEDFGTFSEESCDYPDFVVPACKAIADGKCERGFVFGGSGNGEAIAANKVRGIRCAVVTNEFTAEMGRRHNDANVASFGGRVTMIEKILECVKIFVETPFDGGRHEKRVEKLKALDAAR